MSPSYISGSSSPLFTDLYELTMAQAYLAEGMDATATFSLFYRTLPECRNFVLSCGIEDVVDFLATARFTEEDIAFLRGTGIFSEDVFDYLADFRFSGSVHALPDGTPVFPDEPLVEVTAPIVEAQIMETWVMNQMHAQSVLASKAARVVAAADGRPVLDFGLRRIHGADGGVKAARAFHLAGVAATSNVLAGRVYGIPIAGTMAHSYIQAHGSEPEAFRRFAKAFPETVLLVDTYDTLDGVRNVIGLARELGDGFRVRGIRLDSGDLGELAWKARRLLDEAGLESVEIFASGGLDEYEISDLLGSGAPIDGFGVGTAMGVSQDAPSLDMAYKLVEYDGEGRMKLSGAKQTLPGAKQVFRVQDGPTAVRDVLGRRDEAGPGRTLLEPFMEDGRRVRRRDTPDRARERASRCLAELPSPVRALEAVSNPYPVEISAALQSDFESVRQRLKT